jgi:hypothetical protein
MTSRPAFSVVAKRMSHEPFEPNEVRVCMVIALCLRGASLTIIYRLVG